MTQSHDKKGSIWRRWDLHIHTPNTKLSNGFGNTTDEIWNKYIDILERSDVAVFGITDYFSYENYFEIVSRYKKRYPEGAKKFFLNMEFRLTETVSSEGKNVHTHVIFDNDPSICNAKEMGKFLSDLKTHQTSDKGTNLRCADLSSTSDFKSATVSISDLEKSLKDTFGNRLSYLIVTAANNDGLRGVDTKSERSKSISDELDKKSHAFFGSSQNTDWFLSRKRYEGSKESCQKPVFSGSDAHSFNDLDRLSGDEPNYEPTWVKADVTFRGLCQTLYEPKGRVYIGEKPSVLIRQSREATRFISSLRIDKSKGYDGRNGTWFDEVEIPFNPELTVIIGNKGSGKSAVSDILGLLGETRQEEFFSFLTDDTGNKKFRCSGYAENFEGKLVWESGVAIHKKLNAPVDILKPEAVKYLPQNYFENLTNEIEVKAFRREIEDVVFSHVDEADRMETSSFDELESLKTEQSKKDISFHKARLRELNSEIVELEKRSHPSFKKALEEQLQAKKRELEVLKKSRPKEVKKPDSETEEQKKVATEISKSSELIGSLERRGKVSVEKLASLKAKLQKLISLKDNITALGENVISQKEMLRETCRELDLNIDNIISHKTDISSLMQKIAGMNEQISVLNNNNNPSFSETTDFEKIVSIPDLRSAYEYISIQIKRMKETLSAPQKRYQSYLQAMAEINAKEKELEGDENDAKAGTVKDLEKRLSYIENELTVQLDKKKEEREALSTSIFESKEKVRDFYEGLKDSVEKRLQDVSSEDFQVTIDASFVLDHSFSEDFFAQINQNKKGYFRGIEEGKANLQKLIDEVSWNDIESVLSFCKKIISLLKENPLEQQVKDVQGLYDFLFSHEYIDTKYELRLGGKNLNQLSPGEKGLLLLVFYLHLDKEKTPLIIDQPEDNLDNDSIFSVLAECIRQAKKNRQIILVTHNPNLAVGADAEQILYVQLDKYNNYHFSYDTGAIENPNINDAIVKVLEGSKPAFIQRRLKYQIN